MEEKLAKLLDEKFDIRVTNKEVLEQAFTHSSYVNEHKFLGLHDNERLEFLGDAVLEYIISDYLYKNYPNYPEGKLSKLRSSIVREESLSIFAVECGYDEFIKLGKGEEANGGRTRPSLLCDLFESVLGAITLDLGMDVAKRYIYQVMIPKVASGFFEQEMDFKTQLQEILQQNGDVKIEYTLVDETGPAHDKEFHVEVSLNEAKIGHGIGKNKKLAEQNAAKNAIDSQRKK